MTRTLVTGANGFIGRHVIAELLRRGEDVVALSRSVVCDNEANAHLHRISADIRDTEQVAMAMKSVDRVIHLAASVATRSLTLSESINVEGTRILASAAAAQPDPPTLVYVSSLAAAGPLPVTREGPVTRAGIDALDETDPCHPISHYGRTKLRAEQTLPEFAEHVPITIVRPPCVFGPGDRNLLALYQTVVSGYNIVLSKKFRYSYISVTDLVTGILAAAHRGKRLVVGNGSDDSDRGIYYLTDPQSVTFVELAEMIAASLDELSIQRRRPLRHLRIPKTVGWLAGGCGEIMMRMFGRRVFLNLDKVREGVGGSWVCDGSRAANELSFRPAADLQTRLVETSTDYHQSDWI